MKKFLVIIWIVFLFRQVEAQADSVAAFFIGGNLNVPEMLFGFNGGKIYSDKVGFYFLAAYTFNAPGEDFYYDNISINKARYDFRDREEGIKTSYMNFEGGLILHIYKKMFIRGGIGYQQEGKYYKFHDDMGILGVDGEYYPESEIESGVGLSAGLMFIISESYLVSLGYNAGVFSGVEFSFSFLR
jgi:hypothetical protein